MGKEAINGNPARYLSTLPTLSNGDSTALMVDSRGRLLLAAEIAASVGGTYNATPPTIADQGEAPLQMDSAGNLKVREQYVAKSEDNVNDVIAVAHRPISSSSYSGTAFSARLNDVDISVKGSTGNLLSVVASNVNVAIRYLQIFNKATAPSAGNTPVFSFPIPAGVATAPATVTLGRDFFGANGHNFDTGIAIGISTTADTFTGATVTDHVVNGTYV